MIRSRRSTRGKTRARTAIREPRKRRVPAFLEYETFAEQKNDDGSLIELNDEESWGDENTRQDAAESESPDFQSVSSIRPLWLLYKGRLVWAGARLGRDIREREFFRRRIQAFLDFLADEFPDKSDEDRLLAMQGLFMEEKEKQGNEGASTAWLDHLGEDGIVYGEGKILSLKMLRTKTGGGGRGGDSCPRHLLLLWLDRELKKRPGESPLEWKNCQDWIMGINDFLSLVNDRLNSLVSSGGIGLKERHFHYEVSTVQRRHLGEWKKWWEARA